MKQFAAGAMGTVQCFPSSTAVLGSPRLCSHPVHLCRGLAGTADGLFALEQPAATANHKAGTRPRQAGEEGGGGGDGRGGAEKVQMNPSWPLSFSFLSEKCFMGPVGVQGPRACLAHL